MKGTNTVSLFAAFSIFLAALTAFISPIVDVDCGIDPSHLVMNIGKVVGPSAENVSITQPYKGGYESTEGKTSSPCDQSNEGSHVHGVHSHVAGPTATSATDFGWPSLIASSSVLQLAERDTQPPVKPPRIST